VDVTDRINKRIVRARDDTGVRKSTVVYQGDERGLHWQGGIQDYDLTTNWEWFMQRERATTLGKEKETQALMRVLLGCAGERGHVPGIMS
jgi:hypothetical protein